MPDKAGRQRKKGALVWALALPATLLCLGVWEARPLPPTVRVYTDHGYRVREETTRKYRMLPAREWGLGPETGNFCGPRNTRIEQTCKLGTCAIVDTYEAEFHAIK